MDDDSRVIDTGWDALPEYGTKSGDADDAVTVSISTTPGEWLVNTVDAVVVPMSMHELVEALQSHKLTDRSLVWRAGMPEWASVDRVPQLKLAARMPLHVAPVPSVAPVPPRPAPAATPSKPPPNPLRATPATHPVPPTAPTANALPSRRSTLPFGSTAPLGPASRPSNARPSQPRVAMPPAASKEEPEVLAVYARPAATISFDLSPVEPVRATPSVPAAPQTLAPTTTDSAQQRAPRPLNADLSVVAASAFRQVQRSSKRLVLVSSLASAAAASLLTFALSRGVASHPDSAAAHGEATPAAPALLAAAPAPAIPASSPSAAPAPSSEAAADVPALKSKPKPKPKPVHRAKAVGAAVVPRPARTETDTDTATRDPSSEANPYSVKLDDEAPSAKPAPAAHGSGLEADTTPEAATSGSTSPGF